MVIYSHSRLSTYEQCKLKFKFRYIDKLQPEIEHTIEGFLGGIVHESLEWLYNQVINKNIPSLEQLIEYYAIHWNKHYNSEIKIVNTELTPEFYFDKGIKFLIDYYVKNQPFSENTIAIEHQIVLDLDDSGKYQLQGFIDRLVHNKETNIFEIHDYKTGAMKTQEDLDKDRQLALYSLGVRKLFPETKDVYLIWHYLDFNEKKQSTRTIEQLEQLKQDVIQLITQIESEKEFNANPGILCRWCEFRKYCPHKTP
ncbi:PD-(D/E)XK nuclease family protein [Candidatus Pacearchaeota archaeon]|nr:PD-(D/E)XK nuclease family protein [Candidatus Pacearchaeota archaeon]